MSGETSDSSASESDAGTICSICLDVIDRATGTRSTAKLRCGHEFHLDCIGSAFNFKGQQKCPNCGQVEEGNWGYANVRRRSQHFGGSQTQRVAGTLNHEDEILLRPSNLSHHYGSSNQAVVSGTAIPPTIIQNPDFPGIENYYCSSEYYGQASLPNIPISGADQSQASFILDSSISGYVLRPAFCSTQSLSQAYRHHQNPHSGVASRHSIMRQTPAEWQTYYYPFTYPHIDFRTPLAAPIYHPSILRQRLQGTGQHVLFAPYTSYWWYPPLLTSLFNSSQRTGLRRRRGPPVLTTFASDSTNTNHHQQHFPQHSSNASSSSSTQTSQEQDNPQSSSSDSI